MSSEYTGSIFTRNNRRISSLTDIEYISSHVAIMSQAFLSNYHNRKKVSVFKEKYQKDFDNGYIELLLTIHEFPDFNIFDYLSINEHQNSASLDLTDAQKAEERLLISLRNNIILSLIITATEKHLELTEDDPNTLSDFKKNVFNDLSFISAIIERFKCIIIESENVFNVEYDVEVLFLALLGYQEKAKIIKQKHNGYFKKFIREANLNGLLTFDIFLSQTIEKSSFNSLTDSELIIYRKIMNNAALRKFYLGLDFLVKNREFCYIMAEGRIWKNIGKKLSHDEVYNLWSIYYEDIQSIRETNLRNTLVFEYKYTLDYLSNQMKYFHGLNKKKMTDNEKEYLKRLRYKKQKYIDETHLYFVTCLKELLVIFFKANLKELVMHFFTKNKESNHGRLTVPIDIYEICLDYDEDISLDIMENSLTSSTAKGFHMQLALIKKFYRLAKKLLIFKSCKDYLNHHYKCSEDYLGWMSKMQIKNRNKIIDDLTYNHSKKDIKIIEFIKDFSSEEGNQSLKEETNKNLSHHEVANALKETNLIKKSIFGDKFLQDVMNNDEEIKESNEEDHYSCAFSRSNSLGTRGREQVSSQFSSKILKDSSKEGGSIICDLNGSKKIITATTQTENPSITNTTSDLLLINNQSRNGSLFQSLFAPNRKVTPQNNEQQTDSFKLLRKSKSRNLTFFKKSNFFEQEVNRNRPSIGNLLTKKRIASVSRKRFSLIPSGFSFDTYTPKNKDTVLSPEVSSSEEEEILRYPTKSVGEVKKKNRTLTDIKLDRIKKGHFNINPQPVIIEQLRFGNYVCDALCLLSSIEDRNLNPLYFMNIISHLLVYTTSENAITCCTEPLLLIGLGAEFLLRIGKREKKFLYRATTVANELISLGEKIQSSIKDEEMLNHLLKEQLDHKHRNAIEIFAENKFYSLLTDISVGSIVDVLWFGNSHTNNFFKFLRMYRILVSSIRFEEYNKVIVSKYNDNSKYIFQYSEYIQNCSGRYLTDALLFGAVTVYYQIVVNLYANFIMKDPSERPTTFQTFHNLAANTLLIACLINKVFVIVYQFKTGRKLHIEALDLISNIVMLFATVLCFLNFQNLFFEDLTEENFETRSFIKSVTLSILLGICWGKILNVAMTSYSYGPFMRIMMNVFFDFLVFMLVFICITFLFAQVFTLFFHQTNEDFTHFYLAFVNLFITAFGRVKFESFKSLTIFGYVFLMSYTTLSNIILYNLIVGIINNLFLDLESQAIAESRSMLVISHQRIKWDDNYGLLILLPTPLNILSFPFSIIIMFMKDKAKAFNTVLCKIYFVFIALFFHLLIMIIGLFLFPIAFFKSIIHIVYDYLYKMNDDETSNRTLYMIFDLTLLVFKLLKYFAEDLFYFWVKVYSDKSERSNEEDTQVFTKEYILSLRKIFNDLRFKHKKKVVSLNEVYHIIGINKRPYRKHSHKQESFLDTGISNPYTFKGFGISKSSECYSPSTLSHRSNEERRDLQMLMKSKFCQLLDKLIDTEGFIDIERALILLPFRVKYSDEFLHSLKFLNVKVIIRGMRKFLFQNEQNNPTYTVNELKLLTYKLIIKFEMIYSYFPSEKINKIHDIFKGINSLAQFAKSPEALLFYERIDEQSEYDDEEEYSFFDSKNGGTHKKEESIISNSDTKPI